MPNHLHVKAVCVVFQVPDIAGTQVAIIGGQVSGSVTKICVVLCSFGDDIVATIAKTGELINIVNQSG
jgi:hypothetical protein